MQTYMIYAQIYDIRYQKYLKSTEGDRISQNVAVQEYRGWEGGPKKSQYVPMYKLQYIYVFLKTQYRQHKDAKSTEAEGVELEVAGNSIGVVDALHHGGPAREHLNETHPQEDLSHRALCMT